MEVVFALILFAGLIACWLLLPGGTTAQFATAQEARYEAKDHSHVIGQTA